MIYLANRSYATAYTIAMTSRYGNKIKLWLNVTLYQPHCARSCRYKIPPASDRHKVNLFTTYFFFLSLFLNHAKITIFVSLQSFIMNGCFQNDTWVIISVVNGYRESPLPNTKLWTGILGADRRRLFIIILNLGNELRNPCHMVFLVPMQIS